MTTTLAVRFPLGRYHGTPWDRTVNEGDSEWPPSPWRLLRALVSTWHTRSTLASEELEGLLRALADPPSYLLPRVGAGHTRHYLPDLTKRSGETGSTDLTLDPFLAIDPMEELLICWQELTLEDSQRTDLAALLASVPYLGRSESVAVLRLVEGEVMPDERWCRPARGQGGARRLLAVEPRLVSRALLEASPTSTRRGRRLMPQGTMFVDYAEPSPTNVAVPPGAQSGRVQALRWSLRSAAPFRSRHGVLATDLLRSAALKTYGTHPVPAGITGKGDEGPLSGLHDHAHWLWLSDASGLTLNDLVLWAPSGIAPDDVARVARIRRLYAGDALERAGFRESSLVLQRVGATMEVVPEIVSTAGASTWESLTPYLPSRHRHKRQTESESLAEDVIKELAYRPNLPTLESLEVTDDGDWARAHRRYRFKERMEQRRTGFRLRLHLAEPCEGPLALGGLSHLGFGLFRPG